MIELRQLTQDDEGRLPLEPGAGGRVPGPGPVAARTAADVFHCSVPGIRVVVVDDQPLMAFALKAFVDAASGMAVVAVVENGQQAIDAVAELAPDVVLMDLQMPVLDGIEATRRIMAATPVPIVAVTTFSSDQHLLPALRAGAVGFLPKDSRPVQVELAVRAAAEGAVTVTPEAIALLITRAGEADPVADTSAGDSLTQREHEVLGLLASGLANRAMANKLVVSEGTIKAHLGSLMEKLGADNRVDLLVRALKSGIVRIG